MGSFLSFFRGQHGFVQRGFTLVEILVVMAIIGIILGLASVNLMPDDRRVLATEAQRLALLLEMARDDAISRGETLAWQADEQHYAFYRQDAQQNWIIIEKESTAALLRPRRWPEGLKLISLKVDHKDARLVFSPIGMSMPFEIRLALGQAHTSIQGNILGKIKVVDANQ